MGVPPPPDVGGGMVRAAGREGGKDGRRERGSATIVTLSAAHLFPFDPHAQGTIPPVTKGTGGISYGQRQIFTKQAMPADLRPASADCTRRHWEALPASSRTPSGVQSLVEWGEHGRPAHAVRCTGRGVERVKVFTPQETRRGFPAAVAAIQDGDGGKIQRLETVVRQDAKGVIARDVLVETCAASSRNSYLSSRSSLKIFSSIPYVFPLAQ